ncbi:MAG TPA: hypothetical protein VK826_17545 [Bacteroidia bacterium]|nr:hypothetical protein [Bacteroidia bacterium]
MMRNFFPFVLAFLVLGLVAWFVLSELFSRERCVQKVEVPESYLETMDTSRYSVQSILLERTYADDSVLMLFPEANRESQVYLYDQKNYFRLLLGHSDVVTVPQEHKDILRAVFHRPVVNLSGLKEGKYYLHATACNFGGYFEINISDAKALR